MPTKNKYPGRCATCKEQVNTYDGFVRREDGRWTTYCRDHFPEQIKATVKTLDKDGFVTCPYDPDALPLLRALPGAIWNPERKQWSCSTSQADRPRVLTLADRLGLEVAPELRHVEQTEAVSAAKADGLYPFQVEGVDFLSRKKRALLGDMMGLGKTLQALRSLSNDDRAVVICPAALKYMWRDECRKWRPDLDTVVLSGRGSWQLPTPGQLVITNYDILPDDAGDLSDVTLIVDEAHKVKGYKTKRSKRLSAMSAKAARVWALTGTPLLGKPFDLWGTLCSCDMSREVFGSFGRFLRFFNGSKGRWGGYEFGQPDPCVPELLRRVMLRRLRAEVLPDLPSKTYSTIEINGVSSGTRTALDRIWDEYGDTLEAGVLPAFEEMAAARAELAASRIPAMLELVEDAEEQDVPLLVFSAHRKPIDTLETREGWATITGDTPSERRAEIVAEFQAGKLLGVGLTIQAGGVGLTLTRAWRAIFVDLDWTPANNAQAEDRMVRIGQRASAVEIVRLVSDHPLDKRVTELLSDKAALINAAIERRLSGSLTAPEKGETEEEYLARMAAIEAATAEAERQESERVCGELHKRQVKRLASTGRKLPELTPELRESTRAAFQRMLAVCDGAVTKDDMGFNKPDAVIAHRVLSYGLEDDREVRTALAMLLRYPRQVPELRKAVKNTTG